MIDEKKLTEIASEAAAQFVDSTRSHEGLKECESPIEELMFVALTLCGVGRCIQVDQQVEIGDHRVDFQLTTCDDEGCLLLVVVECDGHQFHEKTKEQARRDKARDRELTAQGYTVFRFTGSEVWTNAAACAEEVYQYIDGQLVEAMHREHVKRESVSVEVPF